MANEIRWGLDNPHPFSQIKTELNWEGKNDEYGNRRTWTSLGAPCCFRRSKRFMRQIKDVCVVARLRP